MKRSEIDKILRDMGRMVDRHSFKLPPFCYFIPKKWKEKGHEYDKVRGNVLGWDITGSGMGDSDRVGFFFIILRNDNVPMDKYTKSYAEKLLYMRGGQSAVTHSHWNRMGDTVNRGGRNVLVGVYNVDKEEGLAGTDVLMHSDGREYTIPAGTQMRLRPGESITIQPRLYHGFYLEPDTGPVLLGEVSMCNDDDRNNRFYLPAGHFPVIEENEPPSRPPCDGHPPADSCAKRWKFTASEQRTAKVTMEDMTNVI